MNGTSSLASSGCALAGSRVRIWSWEMNPGIPVQDVEPVFELLGQSLLQYSFLYLFSFLPLKQYQFPEHGYVDFPLYCFLLLNFQ